METAETIEVLNHLTRCAKVCCEN